MNEEEELTDWEKLILELVKKLNDQTNQVIRDLAEISKMADAQIRANKEIIVRLKVMTEALES